jgi:L-asparaginase
LHINKHRPSPPRDVGCAVGAVGLVPFGVYIAMNGMIFKHDEVKRNLKTGQFASKK